jgi:pimeloyl-ACP methyl ester carboxylesterase
VLTVDILGTASKALRRVLVARGAESRVREVGAHRVHHYWLKGTGKGPPVLLVHGLGSSANGFYRLLFGLKAHFSSVTAIDLPGNGFSPLPTAGPLVLAEQVEVLVRFADEVVGEPVFLIGNSLGGAISVMAAARSPKSFQALGLVAPAGAKVTPARFEALMNSFEVANAAQARALTRRLFHTAPYGVLLFAGELAKMYASPTVRGVLAEARTVDFLSPETLASLAMPTLLLWGKSEKLLPYEGVDYFRAHLPAEAEIHEVAGFGHIPQMERPKELITRLVAFAERQGIIRGAG